MITTGLSWLELERITKILDEHSLNYKVDAQENLIQSSDKKETSSATANQKRARGNSAFYQIDIPDSEYKKLPSISRMKLETLGIFPEMEAPSFDEEVGVIPVNSLPATNFQKIMKFVFPVACILLALSYLKRML